MMARTDFKSIDEYIASKPKDAQAALKRVRKAIRRVLPDAVEAISYQIPAFKLDGKLALFFAGWKEHFSLYPANDALIAAFGDELAGRRVSKGTIRFSLSEAVPVSLIERIAKFRRDQMAEQKKGK